MFGEDGVGREGGTEGKGDALMKGNGEGVRVVWFNVVNIIIRSTFPRFEWSITGGQDELHEIFCCPLGVMSHGHQHLSVQLRSLGASS